MSSNSRASSVRFKPLTGGVFGCAGNFALATTPCVNRGLHAVRHMVFEPRAGRVLAVSLDKREALAAARRLLRAAQSLTKRQEAARMPTAQSVLWETEELPEVATAGAAPKTISRRRREVFEGSHGRCHYCGVALLLDGPWHVEHQLPRALGGTDDLVNLVAACEPCNLAKGDQTALEFLWTSTES